MTEEINYDKLDDFKDTLDKLVKDKNKFNENIIQIVKIFKLIRKIDEGLLIQLRNEIKNRTTIPIGEIREIEKARRLVIKKEIKKAEDQLEADARIQARIQAQAQAQSEALLVKQIEKDIAKIIINKFKIITFEENNKTYLYDNGVFLNAQVSSSRIKQEILKIVADKFDKYQESLSRRGMIIEIIKNMTPFTMLNFKLDEKIMNLKNGAIIHRKDGLKFITHNNLESRGIILYTFTQFPIYYKKGAKCVEINKILLDIFGKDQLIDVMEFVAYILFPTIKYDKGMILQGPPDTGETTFLGLVKKFIGRKNYAMTELFTLAEKFQMANLRYKAAIIADDLTDKTWDKLTCSRMKKIITNDQLHSSIKFVQGDEDWWNRCKVLCAGNELPDTAEKSDAWWKRWIIITCLNKFEGVNRNIDLKSKNWSKAEKSGFLNECIRAWRRLSNRNGFREKWRDSDYVRKKWLSNIFPVARFVEKYCHLGDIDHSIDRDNFINKFNEHRIKNGLKEYTGNLITRRLILFDEKIRPIKVNVSSNPSSSGYKYPYIGWNGLLMAEESFEKLRKYENKNYVEFEKLDIDENIEVYDPALRKTVKINEPAN